MQSEKTEDDDSVGILQYSWNGWDVSLRKGIWVESWLSGQNKSSKDRVGEHSKKRNKCKSPGALHTLVKSDNKKAKGLEQVKLSSMGEKMKSEK